MHLPVGHEPRMSTCKPCRTNTGLPVAHECVMTSVYWSIALTSHGELQPTCHASGACKENSLCVVTTRDAASTCMAVGPSCAPDKHHHCAQTSAKQEIHPPRRAKEEIHTVKPTRVRPPQHHKKSHVKNNKRLGNAAPDSILPSFIRRRPRARGLRATKCSAPPPGRPCTRCLLP